jgi:hypothetical protein
MCDVEKNSFLDIIAKLVKRLGPIALSLTFSWGESLSKMPIFVPVN